MRRAIRLLVTCEHGGNRIPARYRELFEDHREALTSHAGYDIGALDVARDVARAFAEPLGARLIYSTTSRLLVDLNRSAGHPRLHSRPIKALAPGERQAIVARHHVPYREQVRSSIEEARAEGHRVVHVSCHSFTAVLDGVARNADIGLLFDPARAAEARLARAWRSAFERIAPALRVRFNYPYRGTSDGLTTTLRRAFPDSGYAGVELEVNQLHSAGDPVRWRVLRRLIVATLGEALGERIGSAGATKPASDGMGRRPRDVPPRRLRVR